MDNLQLILFLIGWTVLTWFVSMKVERSKHEDSLSYLRGFRNTYVYRRFKVPFPDGSVREERFFTPNMGATWFVVRDAENFQMELLPVLHVYPHLKDNSDFFKDLSTTLPLMG